MSFGGEIKTDCFLGHLKDVHPKNLWETKDVEICFNFGGKHGHCGKPIKVSHP